MTKEEIKENVTMRDVVTMYGVKINHNNMCCCPIHKEKHPSMKIYPNSYYCFACGSVGDIFTFVEEMDNCSFKEAFLKLGGTYERNDNKIQRIMRRNKWKREMISKDNNAKFEREVRALLSNAISKCRKIIDDEDPFTLKWCDTYNMLQWLLYIWEELYINDSKEVRMLDVIRMCKRV